MQNERNAVVPPNNAPPLTASPPQYRRWFSSPKYVYLVIYDSSYRCFPMPPVFLQTQERRYCRVLRVAVWGGGGGGGGRLYKDFIESARIVSVPFRELRAGSLNMSLITGTSSPSTSGAVQMLMVSRRTLRHTSSVKQLFRWEGSSLAAWVS